MTGYEKILACVDGSKSSEEAVNRAAEISMKFGSSVTLVYVWEPPNTGGKGYAAKEIPMAELEKIEGAEKILEAAGVPYNVVHGIGHPAKGIIDESNRGYDLVVMGSRGLGGVEGFLLGSVTSRVSHHVRVPLMIVPSK
jgi:nucleotide-binding universal stress UspA family protein